MQGHIALDQAVFPQNTPGFVLDAFARSALWKIGLDYRHGISSFFFLLTSDLVFKTYISYDLVRYILFPPRLSGTGHGVGAALNVHEGPQSISFRFGNMTALQNGMIVSNEPGYYEDHSFGIRIEVKLMK